MALNRSRFADRSRLPVSVAAWALIAMHAPSLARPAPAIPEGSDLFAAPVYYQRYLDRHASNDDIPLLHAGKVRLKHYDPVDVSVFNWSRGNTEYTWFMQMQEMRFLLPLIASRQPQDRALARDWLKRWYAAHPGTRMRADKWGEPMTFAFRGMVFVYYLKMECGRDDADSTVVGMLTRSLLAHQTFLLQEHNFDKNNNHGMIDALGLLETTRVHPSPSARRIAYHRIRTMTRKLVSPTGTQLEHSPLYHFVFMRWVEEVRDYVRDVPEAPADLVDELAGVARRMRVAGYFLQDHAGMMPQVGDTDSVSVSSYSPEFVSTAAPEGATRFYDREAGYAIFKGVDRDRRYVVLRIPAPRAAFTAHMHYDGLGVLVADDGEVILGDAGRYTYTRGGLREYFVSASAHNTVLPLPALEGIRKPWQLYRPVVSAHDASRDDTTRWSAVLHEPEQKVSRMVSITGGSQTVVVMDTIRVQSMQDSVPDTRRSTVLWNLGPDVDRIEAIDIDQGGVWSWTLDTKRGRKVTLSVTVRDPALAAAKVRLVRGEEAPLLAWYSPRQDVRRPVWGIEIVLNADPMATVETRLVLPDGDSR